MGSTLSLDPQISYIAINAAIELERLIKNEKPLSFDNFDSLSGLLTNSYINIAEDNGQLSTTKNFLDPISNEVFRRAYSESYQKNVDSHDELYKQVKKISEQFNDFDGNNDHRIENEHLIAMRDFCIALSKYSQSLQDDYLDDNLDTPYEV